MIWDEGRIAGRELVALGAAGLVAARSASPARGDTSVTVPMMGPSVLNAQQLASWYRATGRTLNVPGETIEALATYYVEEGNGVNIRGDLAFEVGQLAGLLTSLDSAVVDYGDARGVIPPVLEPA